MSNLSTTDAARAKLREFSALLDARAWDQARACFADLVNLACTDIALVAEAWLGIARACIETGDMAGGKNAFAQAHHLAPADPRMCAVIAKGLLQCSAIGEALTVAERGLAAAPKDVNLLRLLADIHDARHDFDGAIAACETLAALTPKDTTVRVKIGRLWIEKQDNARAEAEFHAALAINPNDVLAMDGLADIWRIDGPIEKARNILIKRADASRDAERRAASRFKAAFTQPVIAKDAPEIDAARRRFADALAAGPEVPYADPWILGLGPNFYLAYQARDDRALQEALAAYYRAATPSLGEAAPHVGQKPARRLRVGIVSNFFTRHTVGYLNYGLIAGLDRARFELVLYRTTRAGQDEQVARFLAAAPCIDLPANLAAARAKIAEARLDILHYPEVGMDHFSYFLAFARLATVQTVGWGHPVTTGLPNIDLFLSVDAMEPPGAEAHYREKLVRLQGLSFAAERPAVPGAAETGLDHKRPSYLCAQSLFKIHHEFDATLAEVLRRDRDGLLYFVSLSPNADYAFKARLARTLGADMARVRLLPRMSQQQFLHLVKAADVVLDVPHWSGGKTALETLAMGTPIVHQPGAFMRGRHTLAFYRRMGIDAPVAGTPAAYAETAARLVHDQNFRKDVRGQIEAQSRKLFGDVASIREIEEVWAAAVRERSS